MTAGSHGDDLYLVMQLVNGCPISTLLDETEIPIAWAVAIAAQVCSVLAVAHANSLVHRDLKPANLMLCPDGTVKVLDFGIAATLVSPNATRLTRTGEVLGTPAYMAPEQAMSGAACPQSDLYSLGVILDEMLAGENQFAAPTALASMRNHTDIPPRPLRARRRDVPEGLERLVLWLLAKTPEKRRAQRGRRLRTVAGVLPRSAALPRLREPGHAPSGAHVRHRRRTHHPSGGEPQPVADRPRLPTGADQARRGTAQIGLHDIEHARKDAQALKAESRFSQAADVLAEMVGPAAGAFGSMNSDVVDLRIELAEVLFLGGDYRRAAPEFHRLAADVAKIEGPGNNLALRCRLMEANCHAAVGETSVALIQLHRLLTDEQRFGADEERVLELRCQIGLLEFGSGNRTQAKRTLGALLSDLERRYGQHHPDVGKVREILENLDNR